MKYLNRRSLTDTARIAAFPASSHSLLDIALMFSVTNASGGFS
jgi:hypothetical protein